MSESGGQSKDRSYKGLKVWQAATDLAVAAYLASEGWPPEERYGMISQVRRASVSVAANIAEGWGRRSSAEFVRFLLIASGSLKELETLIVVANRVGFASSASKDAIESRCGDVGRMLNALIASIERRNEPSVNETVGEYGSAPDIDPGCVLD